MNRFTKLPALLALLCTVTFFSCSKDDEPAKSKTELITSGQWKMTAFTSNPAVDWDNDGVAESDIYAKMDACDKDDLTLFGEDGTGVINEGPTSCDPGTQSYPFEWSFTDNENKLIMDGSEFTILQLNSTTLKIRQTFVYNSVTATSDVTFIKQ